MRLDFDAATDMNSASEPVLAKPPASRPISINHGFSGEMSDLQTCSNSIWRGSKSFHLASTMLPSRIRRAAHALYAFCRHSDDMIDTPHAGEAVLVRLRVRLERIYAGDAMQYACDQAFARVVHEYAIPKNVPLALLDGFAMDIANQRYRTIGELATYANCVAASVGVMMAMVMDAGEEEALARAADLGIAMQFTNIARDVGEDARNGRLYLPLEWMEDAGLDPDEFLAAPRFSLALAGLIRRLLDEADHHYRLGHAGIKLLPSNCRHAIRTAALVYQGIGDRVALQGYNSVDRRAKTTLLEKLAIVARARKPIERVPGVVEEGGNAPPHPAAAKLVEESAKAFKLATGGRPVKTDVKASAGTLDRFATIMHSLETRNRNDLQVRRPLVRERQAGIA